jgi:uncharacterized membrane protein YhaH (DUF805 family)
MKLTDLDYGFLAPLLIVAFIISVMTLLVALLFTIEAIVRRLHATALIIYWLLFIPAIVFAWKEGEWSGAILYLIYSPVSIGALVFYRRSLKQINPE